MKSVLFALTAVLVLGGCAVQSPSPSPVFPEREWRHEDGQDPGYLLAPGDELEILVHTAPELSRTVTIGPDGRFRMPYSGPITAAARSVDTVRTAIIVAMMSELKDPDIDVLLIGTASQRIFVGGEVENPGMVDLPGLLDPLQAIIMAGGITDEGRSKEVILMRRLPGGEVKSAVFDINAGIFDPKMAQWTPLRRFDVVYVPRKAIADQNLFVQQYIRNALPIDFSLFYDVAGGNR